MISILDRNNDLLDLAREALGSMNLNNGSVSVQPFSRIQNQVDTGAAAANYYPLASEASIITTGLGTPNAIYYGYLNLGFLMSSFTAGTFQLLGFIGAYRIDQTLVEIPIGFGTPGAAVAGSANLNYSFVSPRPLMMSYVRITVNPTAGNWIATVSSGFQGYKFIGT